MLLMVPLRQKLSESGFTLIEQLIAMLVLGVGVLGALGVIINSLKLTSSSNYRTIAAQEAYAMAEAVRANPFLIDSITAGTPTFSAPLSATITTTCLQSSGCDQTQYVNTVYGAWQEQLGTVLPQGAGTICRDSNPTGHGGTPANWNCDASGPLVIKVCWNESRIAASSATATATGLICTWSSL